MKFLQKIAVSIFVISCVLLFFHFFKNEQDSFPLSLNSELKKEMPNLIDKVSQTIELSPLVQNLSLEQSKLWREKTLKIWNQLTETGYLELSGKDQDIRPSFIAIQAAVEQSLAYQLKKEIVSLKGFIMTPLPAGSLCSTGEISKELIEPFIELDAASLFGIKSRTTIVRDFLFKGGELYIIYPKKGFRLRSLEQQKIYTNELLIHTNSLFDVPLNCDSLLHDLVGALYFFQTQDGQVFVFGIKMMQEKNAKEKDSFNLWLGSIHDLDIQKRIKSVNLFLEKNSCSILTQTLEEFSIFLRQETD